MKKILALMLALCMVFALCACGSSEPAAEDAAEAPAAEAPAEEAPAEEEAAPAEKVRIGMVTDVGGVNDQSFNQTSWEGLQALDPEVFEVNYLESKTDADYQTNINTFIDEGYDLIICVGYMLADATREAAEANPDQLFAIIDDSTIDLPNVACLMFAQEQASYLVGLVAGSVTESKIVGYVQGMVSDSMNLFGIGYITGVLEACPDAQVLQYNVNNFGDIAGGSTAAKDMITKGADVIYHAAGGSGIGVISACDEEGIWAIGVDTDQASLAPDHVLTSAMKRVDVASQDISKAVAEGNFTAGVHMYDLSNGGVDLAPTRDHIPAEVLETVEAAKTAIINGEKSVPTSVADCPAFTLAE
ncbi:MAG TPA: BMP family ABC transporter substrate-binding protein [Candidatus Limivicinus faecipullorum]|nr:BMP family ABC transporter substrate-binding protein [Candidatus Limivicinus faecipullorum]